MRVSRLGVRLSRSAGAFDQRRKERRLGRLVPPSAIDCKVGPRALEAIRFWAVFFASWDRQCPLTMDVGPCSSWSFLGRVDAATLKNHGGGGFIFDPLKKVVLVFSHVWSQEEKDSAMVIERVSTTVLEAYICCRTYYGSAFFLTSVWEVGSF